MFMLKNNGLAVL